MGTVEKKENKSFCEIDKAIEGKDFRREFSMAGTIFIARAVARHKYLCFQKNINIGPRELKEKILTFNIYKYLDMTDIDLIQQPTRTQIN